MRRKSKRTIPAKYILMALTFLCVIVMFISFTLNLKGGPLNTIAGYVFIPMQQGINTVGEWITDKTDNLKSMSHAVEENKLLKEQIEELNTELSSMKLEQYKLDDWQKLYEEEEKYSQYRKLPAQIIYSRSTNWFNGFIINKGENDGIEVGMNVIASGGLVGSVYDVGPTYAKVRSIIDDSSSVGGMTLSTSDFCLVSGNLQMLNEDRVIEFTNLKCKDGEIEPGEEIITSYLSDKYLPDILIGHVQSIKKDANNLTHSGTITTAVDFEHLRYVLVILDKKEQIKE